MKHYTINIEFGCGTAIEIATAEAIDLATREDCGVKFDFNDVTCYAYRNTSPVKFSRAIQRAMNDEIKTVFSSIADAEPPTQSRLYELTPDMGEISGMGGGYEAACCKMVLAGLKWLDDNPKADPKFRGYKDVFGLLNEDNQDAKDLSKAVCDVEDGCSGAMHHAAINHVMAFKRLGWEEYCKQRRERHAKEQMGAAAK